MNELLASILGTVTSRLSGIIHGVESALSGQPGTVKKAEALRGIEEVLTGISLTGIAVPKELILNEAGALIDVYVAVANAIGAFTHGAPSTPAP